MSSAHITIKSKRTYKSKQLNTTEKKNNNNNGHLLTTLRN